LPALGLDARDGAIEGVLAGASLRRLAVEEMQAQHKEQAKRSENGHADAQSLDGRAKIGERARGEIECDSHSSARSRQRACDAGKTGMWQGRQGAFFRPLAPCDHLNL